MGNLGGDGGSLAPTCGFFLVFRRSRERIEMSMMNRRGSHVGVDRETPMVLCFGLSSICIDFEMMFLDI